MPTWRVDINMSIPINTADMEASPFLEGNFDDVNDGPGSTHNILKERTFLDVRMIRILLDRLLSWDTMARTSPPDWKLRGAEVATGTDGEFISTNIFESAAYTFTTADVGRYVFVEAGQAGKLNARGHYKITNRINNNRVNIDGIIPAVHTGLTFAIHEPSEVIAVLVSDP